MMVASHLSHLSHYYEQPHSGDITVAKQRPHNHLPFDQGGALNKKEHGIIIIHKKPNKDSCRRV
jgi:hypothetical protein